MLLFMITAKHTAESCPGGIVRPDMEFVNKLNASMKKSKVTLVEGYSYAPAHEWTFIVEANDNASLNEAVEPLRLIGEVRVAPVIRFSEAVTWFKKNGIQK